MLSHYWVKKITRYNSNVLYFTQNLLMKILRKYLTKKLITKILGYIGLSLIFSSWWFFAPIGESSQTQIGNIVLAAESDDKETAEEKMWDMIMWANVILKMLYVLIRPLLFIAGVAVDNSVVYGSFLNMDAPLFTIWNILKNFANFALWFLVLFNILKMVFDIWWKSSSEVKKVITNTLIAWVLIQASWFAVAAVIDISTVATYAIWSMPTASFGESELMNKPVLKNISVYDTAKLGEESVEWEELYTYYSYWEKNLSPCWIKKLWKNFYVIWNRFNSLQSGNVRFDSEHCVYFNEVYKFNPAPDLPTTLGVKYKQDMDSRWSKVLDKSLLSGYLADGTIILLSGIPPEWYWLLYSGSDSYNDFYKDEWESYLWMTIDSLLQDSKWYVGPFVTIYSSLLNFSDLTAGDSHLETNNVYENFFIFIVKILFSLAMLAPLIALAIVLIVRVWFLRLVIAFSPWIVLISVFKFKVPDSLKNYVNISNIIKVIFAPVIIVFAINISILFLSAIQSSFTSNSPTEWKFMESMNIQQNDKTISFLWLIEIEYNGDAIDNGKNIFSYMITMMMGLWVMWFILFAAIGANSIWKSVWWWVKKTSEWLMWQLPIIPLPTGGWVGVSWLNQLKNEALAKYGSGRVPQNQVDAMEKAFPWLNNNENKKEENKVDTSKVSANYRNEMWSSLSSWSSVQEVYEENKNLLANAGINNSDQLTNAIKTMDVYKTSWSQNIPDVSKKETFQDKQVPWYNLESYEKKNIDNNLLFDEKWKDFGKSNIWTLMKVKDENETKTFVITKDWNGNVRLEDELTYETKNFGETITKEITTNIQKDRLNKIDQDIQELKAKKDKEKESQAKQKIQDEIDSLEKHRAYYKQKTDALIEKNTPQTE